MKKYIIKIIYSTVIGGFLGLIMLMLTNVMIWMASITPYPLTPRAELNDLPMIIGMFAFMLFFLISLHEVARITDKGT